MSSHMFKTITSQQVNMIDTNRLSGGIQQYMEDGYTWEEAVEEVLHNEGWELQGNNRFYNESMNKYANCYRLDSAAGGHGMIIPVSNDPLVTNVFRVVNDGVNAWVEPNEWKSMYDCRKGKRLLKKRLWQQEMEAKKQSSTLSMNKERIY